MIKVEIDSSYARHEYPPFLDTLADSRRNGGSGEVGAEDGGSGGTGKKKKGGKAKSAKMIPLELQRLFARLQLLDVRTVSTEVCTCAQPATRP